MSEETTPQEIRQDMFNFILAGTKSRQIINTEQGQQVVDIPDPEIPYWMTRDVNSNTFGRFALKLKLLEGMAEQTVFNMSSERAKVLTEEIMNLVAAYKRSIDAKSSESLHDKDNRKQNFIDKFVSAKSEKIYTVKENVKKGLGASLIGRDVERD